MCGPLKHKDALDKAQSADVATMDMGVGEDGTRQIDARDGAEARIGRGLQARERDRRVRAAGLLEYALHPLRVVHERVPVPLEALDDVVPLPLAVVDGVLEVPLEQDGEESHVGGVRLDEGGVVRQDEVLLERPVDIAYLDPPYAQHQYGSNYHLLTTIARWDRPPAPLDLDGNPQQVVKREET